MKTHVPIPALKYVKKLPGSVANPKNKNIRATTNLEIGRTLIVTHLSYVCLPI